MDSKAQHAPKQKKYNIKKIKLRHTITKNQRETENLVNSQRKRYVGEP